MEDKKKTKVKLITELKKTFTKRILIMLIRMEMKQLMKMT